MTHSDFIRIARAFPGERIQIDVTYVHDPGNRWMPRDRVEATVKIGDEVLRNARNAEQVIAYFDAARKPQRI